MKHVLNLSSHAVALFIFLTLSFAAAVPSGLDLGAASVQAEELSPVQPMQALASPSTMT